MNVGAITGDIVLNFNPALQAEKAVTEGARQMKAGVENENAQAARNVESTWKNTLGNLKDEFGKSSMLGQTMKLLAGGGAVMGLSMVARQFDEMTASVSKTANALRVGEIDGRQATAQILEQIPIVGSLAKGFDNLYEAITGEAAAVEREISLVKQMGEAQEAAARIATQTAREQRSETIEWAREIGRLRDEWTLLNTAMANRGAVTKDIAFKNAQAALEEKYEKDSGFNVDGKNVFADKAEAAEKAAAEAGRLLQLVHEINEGRALQEKNAKGTATAEDAARFQKIGEDLAKEPGDTGSIIKSYELAVAKMQAAETEFRAVKEKADAAQVNFDEATSQLTKNKALAGVQDSHVLETYAEMMRSLILPGSPEIGRVVESLRHRSMERLPNPTIQAEELFGPKTAGDTMPHYADVERENTKSVERNSAALDKVGAALDKLAGKLDGGSGGAVTSLDTLAGG